MLVRQSDLHSLRVNHYILLRIMALLPIVINVVFRAASFRRIDLAVHALLPISAMCWQKCVLLDQHGSLATLRLQSAHRFLSVLSPASLLPPRCVRGAAVVHLLEDFPIVSLFLICMRFNAFDPIQYRSRESCFTRTIVPDKVSDMYHVRAELLGDNSVHLPQLSCYRSWLGKRTSDKSARWGLSITVNIPYDRA